MSVPERRQRDLLIASTAIAVVTDATLIPFFPRLFATSFGVQSPEHVGIYLAATCLVVMLMLPVWAWLEKRYSTLPLLVVGQAGAGALALVSANVGDVTWFWATSLSMIGFKASYLLVYPYVMRLVPKSGHVDVIGLLTVILHLGGIMGATIGGWVLEHHDPRNAYYVMAAGDFIQMGVSVYLVAAGANLMDGAAEEASAFEDGVGQGPSGVARGGSGLARLGVLMVVVYFSAFVTRPFFVEYWSSRSPIDGAFVGGWVFAIPALASLVALGVQRMGWHRPRPMWVWLLVVMCGVGLEAVPSVPSILVGRFVMGWAGFHGLVALDVALFDISPPHRYAQDFARMNLCQQGGVLVAFWVAGVTVDLAGLTWPFFVALAGFAAALFFLPFTGPRLAAALGTRKVADA